MNTIVYGEGWQKINPKNKRQILRNFFQFFKYDNKESFENILKI
jgi:hypothetical protein